MISYVSGVWAVPQWGPPSLIDANGVGWAVEPDQPAVDGEQAQLWVQAVYRDGEPSLYGFISPEQRETFKALVKVQGVGPSLAMAILRDLGAGPAVNAARNGNPGVFRDVKGVGATTASRIVATVSFPQELLVAPDGEDSPDASPAITADDELLEALTNLGFDRLTARRALTTTVGQSEPKRMKAAIRLLGGHQ